MAIAHVQSAGSQATSAVASLAVALGSNAVAGNMIVVVVAHYQAGTYTVTDSQGNTYTQDATILSGNDSVSIWSASVGSSAALTATITNTGGNKYTSLAVSEFSGAANPPVIDGSNSANGSAGGAQTGSVTASLDGCLYVGGAAASQAGAWTADSPFTNGYSNGSGSGEQIVSSYYTQTTAAALAVSWTGGSSVWVAAAAVYRPPSAGGGLSIPIAMHHYKMLMGAN